MNDLSRRNLLRTGAGAAVAVPMVAISTSVASAAGRVGLDTAPEMTASAPVMFAVHDVRRGEVSIMHGENEVVVVDKKLVARILHAATSASTSSITSATSAATLA